MVQIIDQNRPNFASALLGGLTESSPNAFDALLERKSAQKRLRQENDALEKQDINLSGIQDPNIRRSLLQGELDRKAKAEEFEFDTKNYDTIKDAFGEKFANIWKASPTGGRTELLRAGIDAKLRGNDVQGLFDQLPDQLIPQTSSGINSKKEMKDIFGKAFDYPELEIPEGITPKERVAYEKDLRSMNSPLLRSADEKIKSLKGEKDHLKILRELSPKIKEGISRLFVNKDGEISPLAQRLKLVPKDTQRFQKTVNDFIKDAKGIFGSRVTNFDLQAFKSRLPTLLNTKEGREEIIQQMDILNEIESNYVKALQNVYRNYGLGKITEEQASTIAEEMVADREQELRDRLQNIGNEPSNNQLPPGIVLMLNPQGVPLYVPQSDVEKVLSLGGKIQK